MKQALITALCLTQSLMSFAVEMTGAQIYHRVLRSTVFIQAEGSAGTGVMVGRHLKGDRLLILTNFHVVASKNELGFTPRVKVSFPVWGAGRTEADRKVTTDRKDPAYSKDMAFDAYVTVVDPSVDLALLEIEEGREEYKLRNYKIAESFFLPIEFAPVSPAHGDVLHTVGNAGKSGGLWNYRHGTVSNIYSKPELFARQDGQLYKARVVEHQVPINPGDSGGALVDSKARLVALNVSFVPTRILREGSWETLEENRLISHGIHLETITQFFERAGVLFADWDAKANKMREDKSAFTAKDFEARGNYFLAQSRVNAARDEFQQGADTAHAAKDIEKASELGSQASRLFARIKQRHYGKKIRVENNLTEDLEVYYSGGLYTEGSAYMTWTPKENGKFLKVTVPALSNLILMLPKEEGEETAKPFLASDLILYAESESGDVKVGSTKDKHQLSDKEGYLSEELGSEQIQVFRADPPSR